MIAPRNGVGPATGQALRLLVAAGLLAGTGLLSACAPDPVTTTTERTSTTTSAPMMSAMVPPPASTTTVTTHTEQPQ